MASKPLFIIPDFFCIFQMNFAMANLDLKEMGKFFWEGREKCLPSWLFQFSFAKVAIAKFIGKMQKKSGIMKSGVEAMPLFLLDDLLKTGLSLNDSMISASRLHQNFTLSLLCGGEGKNS